MPSHQGYDPILTTMDPPVTTQLPSTNSSQQLMQSDGDGSQNSVVERSVSAKEWFTVAILCYVNLINYMDRYTVAGVLTDIQSTFGIGDDEAGLLQTLFILSFMVFAPVFGYFGDRFSRRWLMILGVIIWSATTLLGSFMTNFKWFMVFRALVGVGEASYSTIAPTIISDLFVTNMRSKMLALFYFAIPVGSGMGYVIGSEMSSLTGEWRWGLRVTPILGALAVILLFTIKEPERGESEGSHHLESTSYKEDIVYLFKNRSFMLSTIGLTCVAFVVGALSWWGPKFMYLGFKLIAGDDGQVSISSVSLLFGILAMIAGIIGVPLGSFLSQLLSKRYQSIDPIICAVGFFLSVPILGGLILIVHLNKIIAYVLLFFGMIAINLNWAITADILLYVVVPTRRSTAEAFQILFSHAFGDAGSPYLIGVLSEAFKKSLRNEELPAAKALSLTMANATIEATTNIIPTALVRDTIEVQFKGLQRALFSTNLVEVLGGVFFLFTAAYIVKDRERAARAVKANLPDISESSSTHTEDSEHLMSSQPIVDIHIT